MRKALFVATADVHLSENAPSFRSPELDWFGAQKRQLRWLKELLKVLGCPLIVAGDIFDKAIGSSRLINFAIDEFPVCYAIPGNHDLPYHDYNNKVMSSYGTLEKAGIINDIDGVLLLELCGKKVAFHGIPFNSIKRNNRPKKCVRHGDIDIAVVHEFVWTGEPPFGGTKLGDSHLDVRLRQLPGYDYYIFGDNHSPFDEGNVYNCGTFYRRKMSDLNHKPSVLVFYTDGAVERKYVPIDEDRVTTASEKRKEAVLNGAGEFAELFDSMHNAEQLMCDPEELLKNYLLENKVDDYVKEALLAIAECRDS